MKVTFAIAGIPTELEVAPWDNSTCVTRTSKTGPVTTTVTTHELGLLVLVGAAPNGGGNGGTYVNGNWVSPPHKGGNQLWARCRHCHKKWPIFSWDPQPMQP